MPNRKLTAEKRASVTRLKQARADAGICAATASAMWLVACCTEKTGAMRMPDDLLPTPAALAEWLKSNPAIDMTATTTMLAAVMDDTAAAVTGIEIDGDRVYFRVAAERISLTEVHAAWCAKRGCAHPLIPTIKSWIETRENTPDLRANPILPATLAEAGALDKQAKEAGVDFIQAATGAQQFLLELPESEHPYAIPLRWFEIGMGKRSDKSRGAPVALRLFWEALLNANLAYSGFSQRLTIPQHVLMPLLYPNGWRAARDIPKVLKAGEQLASMEARMTVRQGKREWLWQVVSMTGAPMNEETPMVLDVHLPAGSMRGPVIDVALLRQLGVTSKVQHRGYINLTYFLSRPGKTQGRLRSGQFLYKNDPDCYPRLLTADGNPVDRQAAFDLVHFFHLPGGNTRKQLHRVLDKDLPRLVKAGGVQIVDGHLMPMKARPEKAKSKRGR